jgi:CHAT domain-containing protein
MDPILRHWLGAEADKLRSLKEKALKQEIDEARLHDCPYAAPYYWAAFTITGIV